MSEIAVEVRSERKRWAAPGSAHDRLVAILRIVLPAAVGVVAAMMVFLPLTSGGDVSFVLDKNKVEVAKERLRVQTASYRGQDDKGQPFVLDAGSAIQKSTAEPLVHLNDLAARIQLTDGPATIAAPTGQYDMEKQEVAVDGPLTVHGPDGYQLKSDKATLNLKTRTVTGHGGINGVSRQGTFSADTMIADLENRVVKLNGRVHLRLAPGRAR
jgi:lipopolysaccharide export system protein LptC